MTQDLGAAAGASSAGTGDTGGATNTAPQTWLDKIEDTGLRDFAINKGYNKGSLEEVAPNILRSYQHMEKLIGAEKAGNTVILPDFEKEDAKEAIDSFYNRIGRPKEGAEYDLALPKTGVDADFEKWARDNFHGAGLTARQATALGKAWTEFSTTKIAAMQVADQQRYAEEDKALKQEWGAAYADKLSQASATAKALGIKPEAIDALQKVAGYSDVMKHFATLAEKLGEHNFVSGEGDRTGALTPGEAKAELQKLQYDKDWMTAWLDRSNPKHKEAMDRKARLDAAIVAGR